MRRNFPLLLSQGAFYTVAVQLTSAMGVIPFICAELDGPRIVVALLAPIYSIGTLIGNVVITQILRWQASVVTLLFGIVALQAFLSLANASTIAFLPENVSPYLLLATAALIGMAAGLSRVIASLSTAALLPPDQQANLLIRQAGYGAALVTLISAYSAGFLSDDSPGIDNAELLWVGAATMAISTVCCLGLRPIRNVMPGAPMQMGQALAVGVQLLRNVGWLRRYLTSQAAFTSIRLSAVFYGIYSAECLGPDNGSLDSILTFVGLGLLAGIPIWSYVRKRFDVRGMLVCSAIIGTSAAALTLVLISFRPLPLVWTFGLAMMLIAIAGQAVFPASHVWIEREVTDDNRVVVLSFTQIVASVVSIGIALIFGFIARHGLAIWPLGIILVLNLVAVISAARVRVPDRRAMVLPTMSPSDEEDSIRWSR